MQRRVANWMVHLADPEGPRTLRPSGRLDEAASRALFLLAERHGVLPSIVKNSEFLADDSKLAAIRDTALERYHGALGFSLMLRRESRLVMAGIAAAGLPAVLVKGEVFARRLYPDHRLRRFTDVDVLVAPEAIPAVGSLLADLGYGLLEENPAGAPQEWKWCHRQHPELMIEVHRNLVHAGSLRARLSLTHADLVQEGGSADAERPSALLAIAVIHGACHQYDRLLQLVDVCEAARNLTTADEERRFEALLSRSGARPAAITCVDLAGRLFDEPRCREVTRSLGTVKYERVARWLINRQVVASTMSPSRPLYSWRRAAYRYLLKRRQ